MAVKVGTVVFPDWKAIYYPPAGWTDTFIFDMQYDAGLPPDSYVEGLKKLIRHFNELRRGASLWVRVEAPGNWYVREVRRALREEDLAIAVTKSGIEKPKFEDFSIPPYTIKVPSPPPLPQEDWDLRGLAGDELKCLRVLDRLRE